MKFEAYCDESSPDAIGKNNSSSQFLVIGSLWLPSRDRNEFKDGIHSLRNEFRVGGEFKWNRISPSRQEFYCRLIDYFFDQGSRLRFRCIAVDCDKVDLAHFHESDQELGFYKFYYQLLHHWILDFNDYTFFLDFKQNRRRDRLHVLKRTLDLSNLSSKVLDVQAVESRQSVLVQLCDVLTGAVARRLNKLPDESVAKAAVLTRLENRLGRSISPTTRAEQKLNVFRINLSGGW